MANLFKISTSSAFRAWKPAVKESHAYDILISLLESGQVTLVDKDKKILTPFEACLFMDSLYVKNDTGVLKIIKTFS